jgi:hypothetical protein
MLQDRLTDREKSDRYNAILKTRQKAVERGYQCLCCRDGGLIPAEVIRRHNLLEGMLGEYDAEFCGDAGVLCRNPGCRGNEFEVEVPSDNGSTYTKVVERFSRTALDTSIPPETCKWVHEQEVVRWKKIHDGTLKSPKPPDLKAAVSAIARPMPQLEDDNCEF